MTDTFKKESRRDWKDDTKVSPDYHQIKLGTLQRIADATEAMAYEHSKLVREKQYFKEENERLHERLDDMRRQNSALRGVVTRFKNKISKEAK